MTRDEAHKRVFDRVKIWEGRDVAGFLDALEALGLLKIQEPKARAIEVLFEGGGMSMGHAAHMVDVLERAGLQIVEKT